MANARARAILAALLLAPGAGCGGPTAAPMPRVIASARAPASSASVALSARPRRATEADPPPPDPESLRMFLDGVAQPSVAPLRGPPPRVTARALEGTALGEAPGGTAVDAPVTAVLAVGKRVSVAVSIEPGECATFIAQGGLGVIEVDLFLTRGDAEDAASVLDQDLATGPIAVIGGRRGCFRNPGSTAISGKIHAMVRRGEGPVVVQRYRR